MNSKPVLCLLLIAAACLPGCDVDPETMDSLQSAVSTVSAKAATAPAANAPEESLIAQFEPQYPERVDPFVFAVEVPVNNDNSTTINSASRVQVLGFGNVGEPRVFLRINDRTGPYKVGDSVGGVEVVSIREPVVELRMGSLVWTATMFDKVAGE
jgi:hypothetical protein